MEKDKLLEKKISLLDWAIIMVALIMLIMVYVPSSIWEEELEVRKESRKRMTDISDAEEFYYELTDKYTVDGEELFSIVEAAMDSLIADSLFTNDQIIHYNNNPYNVNIKKGFDVRVDTTFSNSKILKRVYIDTIHTVGIVNVEEGGVDTLYVNEKDIKKVKQDTLFLELYSTDTTFRSEVYTDYLRDKYHLNPEKLFCPLTGEPYLLEIDDSDPERHIFTVRSPVPDDYKERRYGIFQFKAGYHGEIVDIEKSWTEIE